MKASTMTCAIATPLLNIARHARVLTVTMSRAPVNALNDELIAQLDAAADLAIADDGVSVLHIRSDQRAFSAGADLALIRACFATPEGPDAMTGVVRSYVPTESLEEQWDIAGLEKVLKDEWQIELPLKVSFTGGGRTHQD